MSFQRKMKQFTYDYEQCFIWNKVHKRIIQKNMPKESDYGEF